jgi:hypothetical protein
MTSYDLSAPASVQLSVTCVPLTEAETTGATMGGGAEFAVGKFSTKATVATCKTINTSFVFKSSRSPRSPIPYASSGSSPPSSALQGRSSLPIRLKIRSQEPRQRYTFVGRNGLQSVNRSASQEDRSEGVRQQHYSSLHMSCASVHRGSICATVTSSNPWKSRAFTGRIGGDEGVADGVLRRTGHLLEPEGGCRCRWRDLGDPGHCVGIDVYRRSYRGRCDSGGNSFHGPRPNPDRCGCHRVRTGNTPRPRLVGNRHHRQTRRGARQGIGCDGQGAIHSPITDISTATSHS